MTPCLYSLLKVLHIYVPKISSVYWTFPLSQFYSKNIMFQMHSPSQKHSISITKQRQLNTLRVLRISKFVYLKVMIIVNYLLMAFLSVQCKNTQYHTGQHLQPSEQCHFSKLYMSICTLLEIKSIKCYSRWYIQLPLCFLWLITKFPCKVLQTMITDKYSPTHE
jgi:hypothetical protein